MNTRPRQASAALVLAASAVFAGCSNRQAAPAPRPLTPEAFIAPRSGSANAGPGVAEGSGGTVGAGEAARPAVQIPAGGGNTKPQPATPGTPSTPDPTPRSDAAPATPLAPPANGGAASTAGSAAPRIGASSGQFMTLGGVVAEVNGTPVYANKVLSVLDPILREKAKKLDAEAFRRQASRDINDRVLELVRLELFYAAAQRTLDAEDKRLADLLTVQWRMQQITRAGGSVELARRKARDEFAMDFDEMAQEQSRNELLRIFDQKKLVPRIQVSASDIREYYDKHVGDQFSATEKVKFRLLKVDIAKTGGKEQAIAKIDDKLKRARAGEDFAEMARKENDERMFAAQAPLDMNPASFSIAPVREALAKLQPGEVSDPVADPSGFYLVKLEERMPGRVRPFEEQKVQDEIRGFLRRQQYGKLRQQELDRLLKGSVVKPDMAALAGAKQLTPAEQQMLNIALDMAMQKYYQYAAR